MTREKQTGEIEACLASTSLTQMYIPCYTHFPGTLDHLWWLCENEVHSCDVLVMSMHYTAIWKDLHQRVD